MTTANLRISLDFYTYYFCLFDEYRVIEKIVEDQTVTLLLEGPFPESIKDGDQVYIKLNFMVLGGVEIESWQWSTDTGIHGESIMVKKDAYNR
jgi:hypothetical protein